MPSADPQNLGLEETWEPTTYCTVTKWAILCDKRLGQWPQNLDSRSPNLTSSTGPSHLLGFKTARGSLP
jgi:hypothetical protein